MPSPFLNMPNHWHLYYSLQMLSVSSLEKTKFNLRATFFPPVSKAEFHSCSRPVNQNQNSFTPPPPSFGKYLFCYQIPQTPQTPSPPFLVTNVTKFAQNFISYLTKT